ncbi:MAG TPA: pyridoxal-phosphate dependent enzyme, partial [Acidobacteriota bacterium]|nr:pyridoxal-phosphate dependent enzyme [Acidobacteriota bacterium]
DPDVIAGQGTVGLEIHEDVPKADLVLVGIGGGALISGIAIVLKKLNPKVQIIGVEPEGAATMTAALESGKSVKLEKIQTVAEGLAAPFAGALPLQVTQKYVDDVILVSDAEIIAAVQVLLQRAKLLVEPAGAAGVAAMLSGRIPVSGKKVVPVLSGGNLALDRLREWL